MRFGVTANPESPRAVEAAKGVIQLLGREHRVLVEENLASALGEEGAALKAMDIDHLVTVGGDGTILRALQRSDFSILGINISRVGFLTEVGLDGVEDALKELAAGRFEIDERIKLRGEVGGKRLPECTNEAVLHTASLAKVRRFRVKVDGEEISRVEGDGVIVATPTGSTAYSLSAGGPVLDPRVRAFVVTALAPFRQSLRPTVVPADSEVAVELRGPGPCVMVMDGQEEVELKGGTEVTFRLSDKRARFVRFRRDFYARVREKLTEASGP